MPRTQIIFICIAATLCPPFVFAETIELNSGQVVEGSIVMRTEDSIAVDIGLGVPVTYFLEEVRAIDGDIIKPVIVSSPEAARAVIVPDEKVSEHKAISQNFMIENNQIKMVNPGEESALRIKENGQTPIIPQTPEDAAAVEDQVRQIEDKLYNLNTNFSGEMESMKQDFFSWLKLQVRRFQKQIEHLRMVYAMFPVDMVKPLFVSWLICSVPLLFIARKLSMSHIWTALVPGLNFFLLIRMADRSFSCLVHFVFPVMIVATPFYFAVEHPLMYYFVGVFWLAAAFLLIPVLLWIDILRLLQKPTWLAVFTVVPGANIALHVYLALPKRKKRDAVPQQITQRLSSTVNRGRRL